MDSDSILDFLDVQSRIRAFAHYFSKLEAAQRLDLGALKVCIRLCTPQDSTSGGAPSESTASSNGLSASSLNLTSTEKLISLLLRRIPEETQNSDHLYRLAEVLLNDGIFARMFLGKRLRDELIEILPQLSQIDHEEAVDGEKTSHQLCVRKATGYLTLLRCSYWLPSSRSCVVESTTLEFLSRFLGLPATDGVAHDTVSAFLSLLKQDERSQRSLLGENSPSILIDQSLWDRYSVLGPDYFDSGSHIFRTWFQWISQAALDGVNLDCLKDELYWDKLRYGLLSGYADQRKYCIGIIRQSLHAAQFDISTPTMHFRLGNRARYMKIYEQYSGLFETIVLNRYANQVEACLPELTRLFESDITPIMATTLLSAALNSMVQDGVRKIIGNWYATYVASVRYNPISYCCTCLLYRTCIDRSTAFSTC
jgi:tRNA guanosine-2'-O-methyltransferase